MFELPFHNLLRIFLTSRSCFTALEGHTSPKIAKITTKLPMAHMAKIGWFCGKNASQGHKKFSAFPIKTHLFWNEGYVFELPFHNLLRIFLASRSFFTALESHNSPKIAKIITKLPMAHMTKIGWFYGNFCNFGWVVTFQSCKKWSRSQTNM